MNKIQPKSITLAVSMFNEHGWWLGNKDEYVSAGTALGEEFTRVIYTPSAEDKIGKFDQESETWSEFTNNVLTPFWDKYGLEYRVEKPDTEFPEWAIYEQPPEHSAETERIEHDGKKWQVLPFDVEDDEAPEPEPEKYKEPAPEPELTPVQQADIYLNSTDWYVTRKLETGVAIPKDVRANRDKCRALLATALPSTDFLNT